MCRYLIMHRLAGDRFCFEEARQAHSLLAAVCGACFTVAIKWVMLSKRLHAILQRILPQPGTGAVPWQWDLRQNSGVCLESCMPLRHNQRSGYDGVILVPPTQPLVLLCAGPALESIKNGCWQHTIIGYSQEDEPSVQPKVSQRLQQDANSCLRYSISAIMSGVSAGSTGFHRRPKP